MKLLLLLALFFTPLYAEAYSNEYSTSAFQLVGYKPSYFLMGRPFTKVQLSIKTKVIQGYDLHIAYTQLMMWDLFKKSAPFLDINYNPEIFYRFYVHQDKTSWLDAGYQHESNGQGGETSRSWDRLYILFSRQTQLVLDEKTALHWSVAAWLPINRDYLNHDLIHYRGLYEVNLTLHDFLSSSFFARNDLTLRFYPGGRLGINPISGGRELTFRFNNTTTKGALPVITAQIFQGYGENLLDYNKRRVGMRAGFGF